MKIFFTALAISIVISCGSSAVGQTNEPDRAASTPKPTSSETYFLKTGAGLFLTQFHYTNYEDRPVINGVATEIMTWTGVSGFTGSLAGGIDFPDHFSIFLSGDWMAEDFSLMANAQYAFSNWGWAEPYVYFGLGMDYVKQATFGPAGQVGIGMDFPMTRDFTVYAETKAYIALGEWTDYLNEQLTYSWANFYVPVLIGTKLKL